MIDNSYIYDLKLQIIKEYDIFVAKSNKGQMPSYSHIMDMITALLLFESGKVSLKDIRAWIQD